MHKTNTRFKGVQRPDLSRRGLLRFVGVPFPLRGSRARNLSLREL